MSGAPDAGTVNAADSCSGGAAAAASCSRRRRRASASVSTRADESAHLHRPPRPARRQHAESDATQSGAVRRRAGGEVGVERHRHNDRAVSGEVERGRREASGRGGRLGAHAAGKELSRKHRVGHPAHAELAAAAAGEHNGPEAIADRRGDANGRGDARIGGEGHDERQRLLGAKRRGARGRRVERDA